MIVGKGRNVAKPLGFALRLVYHVSEISGRTPGLRSFGHLRKTMIVLALFDHMNNVRFRYFGVRFLSFSDGGRNRLTEVPVLRVVRHKFLEIYQELLGLFVKVGLRLLFGTCRLSSSFALSDSQR